MSGHDDEHRPDPNEQEGLRRDTCDPVAPLLHRQSVLLLVRGKESTIKGMPCARRGRVVKVEGKMPGTRKVEIRKQDRFLRQDDSRRGAPQRRQGAHSAR
jgi:hypothetical protein